MPSASVYRVPSGSSPRVRGKLMLACAHECSPRIIPARAGQTHDSSAPHASCSDHPRACGANAVFSPFSPRSPGSSPRVRGKQRDGRVNHMGIRIIPARAGQTCGSSMSMSLRPDHPRACGANSAVQDCALTLAGSSPRVRGKPLVRVVHAFLSRIIPARAGQTP